MRWHRVTEERAGLSGAGIPHWREVGEWGAYRQECWGRLQGAGPELPRGARHTGECRISFSLCPSNATGLQRLQEGQEPKDHCIPVCVCVCVCVLVTQSCSTLCNPMDCSPPGSSVHAIFQALRAKQTAVLGYEMCPACEACPGKPRRVRRVLSGAPARVKQAQVLFSSLLLKFGFGSGTVNAVTFLPLSKTPVFPLTANLSNDGNARTSHRSPGRTAPFLPGRHDCLYHLIKLKTADDSGWSSEAGCLPASSA